MKKSLYIPFAFLCLLSAMSCIEEKLDPCPPQGGEVTVALRVEKFQARPPYRPSDFEQEFGKRIHSLDYLLYADGQLIGQGARTTYRPLPAGTASSAWARFRSERTGWRSWPTLRRA